MKKIYIKIYILRGMIEMSVKWKKRLSIRGFEIFERDFRRPRTFQISRKRFERSRVTRSFHYVANKVSRRFHYIRAHFAYIFTGEPPNAVYLLHVTRHSPLLNPLRSTERDNLNYKFTSATLPLLRAPLTHVYIHHSNNRLSEKMKLPLMLANN